MKENTKFFWLGLTLAIILGMFIGLILGFVLLANGIATVLDHIQIENVNINLNETKLAEPFIPIIERVEREQSCINECERWLNNNDSLKRCINGCKESRRLKNDYS